MYCTVLFFLCVFLMLVYFFFHGLGKIKTKMSRYDGMVL